MACPRTLRQVDACVLQVGSSLGEPPFEDERPQRSGKVRYSILPSCYVFMKPVLPTRVRLQCDDLSTSSEPPLWPHLLPSDRWVLEVMWFLMLRVG